jgi:glycosyltransferase involved in cell wall biosynthesis
VAAPRHRRPADHIDRPRLEGAPTRRNLPVSRPVVTLFNRTPRTLTYSIENVYELLKRELAGEIDFQQHFVPKAYSLRVARAARRAQRGVNHVTGDVYYIAPALEGSNTVLTVHDVGYPLRLAPPKRWLYQALWLYLPFRHAAHIVCSSHFTRSEIVRRYRVPSAKCSVVHLAHSAAFKPAEKRFQRDRPTILQVGSNRRKNLRSLLKAVSGESVRLCIVGNPGEDVRREAKARKIDIEVHTGVDLAKLTGLYRDCDLVFFASTYEGFGLPILEAQAVGRAVITSKICSMPEVAGKGARLVDPFDVPEIRDAIREIREDAGYRNRLIEAGFRNLERFSPAKTAEGYLRVYRSLAPCARR